MNLSGCSNYEQDTLVSELTQGMELANQLKAHMGVQGGSGMLAEKIHASFEKALLILKWSGSMEQSYQNVVPSSTIPASPISVAGSPKSSEDLNLGFANQQDTRDFSKKRKKMPSWTDQVKVNDDNAVDGPPHDGHSWRKYGQKDILGAKYPRSYYRCTYRTLQGCCAIKQVQRNDEDPSLFDITYKGTHTCAPRSKSAPTSPEKQERMKQNQFPVTVYQQHSDMLLNFQTGLSIDIQNLENQEVELPFPTNGSVYENHTFTPSTPNDNFYSSFPGGVKLEGGAGSRLRFVDQQLRQQRALQQLGMMHQHNAWRPQRGLPERAVSVLRAWLFEHFLHPYPKDSDKHMLAKQTGLTRSQVSNWFINARVRLWKPMVEEMYVEEMKSHEQNGDISEENTNTTNTTTTTTNNNGGIGSSSSKNEHNQDHYSTTTKTTMIPQQHDQQQQQPEDEDNNNGGFSMIQTHQNDHNHHQTTNDMISSLSQSQGFTLIGSSSDMESLMARTSQKKQRSNSDINNSPSSILSMDMEMKPIDHSRHHSSMINSGGVGFNPYIVNDIGRFNPEQLNPAYHGNGVSLTLGLPHGDNLSMSENHQQNFFPNQGMELGRRLDIGPGEADFCGISMGQSSHPTSNEYESIDIQSRKRFAAQILHDFVA